MKVRGRRLWIPAIAGFSVVLIIASVTLGLRISGLGWLSPFPRPAALDYSAGPPGGFAPLDPRLVADLFGRGASRSQATAANPSNPGSRAGDRSSAPVFVSHRFNNDDFAQAFDVPRVPFRASTATGSATTEPGEPSSCSALGGGTAWYRFTPKTSLGLVANTFGSDYSTALTVYTGTGLNDLHTVLSCSSDARGSASVAFPAVAGTQYFFQIAGPLGGDLVFSLEPQGWTTLASVGPNGERGDGDSFNGVIAPSGRSMLFTTGASTFDDNASGPCVPHTGIVAPCGRISTFLRDRVAHGQTDIDPDRSVLPRSVTATQRMGTLTFPGAISANGRFTAYWTTVAAHPGSPATPTSPYRFEVFRRDNKSGHVEPVSRPWCRCPSDGSSGRVEISDDGRLVAFTSWASNIVKGDTNGASDVFVRDMRGATERVSLPDGCSPLRGAACEAHGDRSSELPYDRGSDLFSISGDGRYVVFRSSAQNLVPGPSNGLVNVYVRDRWKNRTVRVNLSSTGALADKGTKSVTGFGLHTISDDGRYVFFNSDATNLVPGTAPNVENVYRRDLVLKRTELVSISWDGRPANEAVTTHDPVHYAGALLAPILVAGGPNVGVSALSYSATSDGRFAVFNSDADNLVPGDANATTDVFLRDMSMRTTTRVSVSTAGNESASACNSPTISADARFVAFDCAPKSGLIANHSSYEVFVRELPGARRRTDWF